MSFDKGAAAGVMGKHASGGYTKDRSGPEDAWVVSAVLMFVDVTHGWEKMEQEVN